MPWSWYRPRTCIARREARFGYLFISPWIIGFLLFVIGPLLASIWLSFTDYELFTPPVGIGFRNYQELLFKDPLYPLSLFNTVYYVIFAVPLGLIVSLLLALLVNQKVKGITVYRTIYYLPSVTSGVAISLLWLWLFNPQLGLINYILGKVGISGPGWLVEPKWAKPALIIMSLWGTGGAMVIFLAGLQGVPTHLYEASELDGANWWQKFRHVTLPMISPVILFNLIMGLIGSFQVFTQAFVMTQGGPSNATLFYVLYLFRNAFLLLRMGYAAAMAWILFLIVLVLTLFQLKFSSKWVYYETKLEGR